MKRRFLIILILVLGGLGAARAQGFYFGPKGGVNFSSVTKTTYSKGRVRGDVGLFAGYQANDILALQIEGLYSWQGCKSTKSDDRSSFNYIKVPVLAKLFIIGGLNVEAGVSFNFLMTAKVGDISIYDQSRKFDLAVPVGVNYLFGRKLELGLRYDISTTRIAQDSDNRAANSNWSVNLSWRF